MANVSVTNTFTNGTTADASQVNTNFTDIINGTSDGTKDFSINALTCAGTATLNGNVNIGNASSDDLSITASLASTLAIKTTFSYDIGATAIGLRSLFFGSNDSADKSTKIIAGLVASSNIITLPITPAAGTLAVAGKYEIVFTTGNGYGSDANNAIMRFTTVELNTGTVSYTDSATAGLSVTIPEDGIYEVGLTYEGPTNSAANAGVSVDASSVTTSISGITAATRATWSYGPAIAGDNSVSTSSRTMRLASGTVVRAHNATTKPTNTSVRSKFFVCQVSRGLV